MSGSEPETNDHIRRRAYELWDAAGRPEGRAEDFWLQACADTAANEAPLGSAPHAETEVAHLATR